MNSYEIEPMFHWIKEITTWTELLNTFNCGVGLLIYLDQDGVSKVRNFKFRL